MGHNRITLPVVQDAISDVACLFLLPEIYLRIQELMGDKHSDLDDFAKVAVTDPNLTASLLKIVNRAYFGLTGQIDGIHRALLIKTAIVHITHNYACAKGSGG